MLYVIGASVFPPPTGSVSTKSALAESQSTRDLHLIPAVSSKQRKYQLSFLDATFKPNEGVVEVHSSYKTHPVHDVHEEFK